MTAWNAGGIQVKVMDYRKEIHVGGGSGKDF